MVAFFLHNGLSKNHISSLFYPPDHFLESHFIIAPESTSFS